MTKTAISMAVKTVALTMKNLRFACAVSVSTVAPAFAAAPDGGILARAIEEEQYQMLRDLGAFGPQDHGSYQYQNPFMPDAFNGPTPPFRGGSGSKNLRIQPRMMLDNVTD